MSRLLLRKQSKTQDRAVFFLAIVFTILGLVAVADASAPSALSQFGDKFYFVKQQVAWAVIGIVSLFAFSKINYKLWEKFATPLFLLTAFGLVVVLLPGVGSRFLGARRWLVIGPVSIQPSEAVKLTLAMYLAKLSTKEKKVLAYFLPLAVVAGLIVLEPDLGTTLVVVTMGMVQIFVSGINLLYFAGAGLLGIVASFFLIVTSAYRRDRLLTYLQQTQDPLGKAYHIRQVLYALGLGGGWGVGLGQSRQKYLFLPEASTDSIFAVIAEEIGFIGAAALILVFAYFIVRCLRIVKNAPDRFSYVLSVGLVSWIAGQMLLNISAMVALVPLTGIPLPFISYGGSSLVSVLMATGILLNISKYAKKEK